MRALPILALLLAFAIPALARESGITTTDDGRFVLVQKDVGDARWAISLDMNNQLRVTGNIFTPGTAPTFVDCGLLETRMNGSNALRDWTLVYGCSIVGACEGSFCPPWSTIPGTVELAGSFFSVDEASPVPTPVPTSTPQPSSGLQGLRGTWSFRETIGSTLFTATYRLQTIRRVPAGYDALGGLDQYGDPVVAAAVRDLQPGSSFTQEWAMLDPGIYLCQLYVFDRNGETVSGIVYELLLESIGDCGSANGAGGPYTLTGNRTSLTASAVVANETALPPDLRRARERLRTLEGRTVARPATVNEDILDLVRVLSQ